MICNKWNYKKIIKSLKKGNVVLLPTETVFGLACIYGSEEGYRKLINIKKRPEEKHFPVCVGNYEQIYRICEPTTNVVEKLLPNPITLILPTDKLPDFMSHDTVAIRYAKFHFLNKLIRKLGSPILLTSANLSGKKPIENLNQAELIFKKDVDVYVRGRVKIGIASTLVKISDNGVEIIREGPISKEQIEEKLER